MPSDIALIEHIDRKFKESRDELNLGLRDVHAKIDELRIENSSQHEVLVGRVTVVESKLESHIDGHIQSDAKSDGWVKLGAAGAVGGLSTWLAKYFGMGGSQP